MICFHVLIKQITQKKTATIKNSTIHRRKNWNKNKHMHNGTLFKKNVLRIMNSNVIEKINNYTLQIN